jgi:hypothetical protein
VTRTVLRGGRVVTPGGLVEADVVIEGQSILRGQVVYRDGHVIGGPGWGQLAVPERGVA